MLITVKYEWWLDIFTNALRGALLNAKKWETNGMEESDCGPPSLAIRCSVEAVNRRHICLPSSLSDWALCLQHAPSSSLTQRVHFTSFSLIRMWCYTKTRLACSLPLVCVCLSKPMSVCECVCLCVCVYMGACVSNSPCICLRACVCVYVYACLCVGGWVHERTCTCRCINHKVMPGSSLLHWWPKSNNDRNRERDQRTQSIITHFRPFYWNTVLYFSPEYLHNFISFKKKCIWVSLYCVHISSSVWTGGSQHGAWDSKDCNINLKGNLMIGKFFITLIKLNVIRELRHFFPNVIQIRVA